MNDLLRKELIAQDVLSSDGNSYHWRGQEVSFDFCKKQIRLSAAKNKKLLLRLWTELAEQLAKRGTGDSCPIARSMFIPAIKSLCVLASNFKKLQENGVVDSIKSALNEDSESFSRLVMSKVIEFRLAIEWLHHLVRRDLYLAAILDAYRKSQVHPQPVVASAYGPWTNVGPRMEDRVFKWSEIEDDVMGREKEKEDQSRYTMGLENYGTGDYSPNEGFVWREIRNDPYNFGDEGESPYPSRSTLMR